MPLDPLSRTLSAIADPTRRAILARLCRGQATVSEIALPFDMSLPAIAWASSLKSSIPATFPPWPIRRR